MNFQIGDLIVTKDVRNRKVPTYVIKVHEPDEDFYFESITIQYSENYWTRLPVTTIESMMNNSIKAARWYHYPVVK